VPVLLTAKFTKCFPGKLLCVRLCAGGALAGRDGKDINETLQGTEFYGGLGLIAVVRVTSSEVFSDSYLGVS
jgi:hypothetical protein